MSYVLSLTCEDDGYWLRLIKREFVTDIEGKESSSIKEVETVVHVIGHFDDKKSAQVAFDKVNLFITTCIEKNIPVAKDTFRYRSSDWL